MDSKAGPGSILTLIQTKCGRIHSMFMLAKPWALIIWASHAKERRDEAPVGASHARPSPLHVLDRPLSSVKSSNWNRIGLSHRPSRVPEGISGVTAKLLGKKNRSVTRADPVLSYRIYRLTFRTFQKSCFTHVLVNCFGFIYATAEPYLHGSELKPRAERDGGADDFRDRRLLR
ncbi:hypothetical protein EVAR_76714_1 [Eumeta japonica]|uniref:Uncharacterized protein n=1 Tax=Eumeta variegata TaxID=151549 RepID=A0A4C1STK8_EUMVA|nr:hypothetical protein EVAR_76714_1 [Eumeta japonica]